MADAHSSLTWYPTLESEQYVLGIQNFFVHNPSQIAILNRFEYFSYYFLSLEIICLK